jgi:Flp pilus assembly pilin Flp
MIDRTGLRHGGDGWDLLRRLACEDSGQDIVEYALITGLFGIVGVLVLQGIQTAVDTTYGSWLNPASGVPSRWDPPDPLP